MRKEPNGESPRGTWGAYLGANLLWYAFLCCVTLAAFIATGRVWDDVFSDAVEFLFLILGGGFTLASLLDFTYDRVYGTDHAVEKP